MRTTRVPRELDTTNPTTQTAGNTIRFMTAIMTTTSVGIMITMAITARVLGMKTRVVVTVATGIVD
jgi:hypothetical protein